MPVLLLESNATSNFESSLNHLIELSSNLFLFTWNMEEFQMKHINVVKKVDILLYTSLYWLDILEFFSSFQVWCPLVIAADGWVCIGFLVGL